MNLLFTCRRNDGGCGRLLHALSSYVITKHNNSILGSTLHKDMAGGQLERLFCGGQCMLFVVGVESWRELRERAMDLFC